MQADLVLVDGLPAVFKAGLTVIIRLQQSIVKCDGFETTLKFLQQAGAALSSTDLDGLIRVRCGL